MNFEAAQIITKPRSVFLNRNFLLLFSGKIISQLGDWVYLFALGWYLLDLTKSSFQMSIFLVIDTIVVALVAPFGGIIADRFNRRGIMVWMDAIRGIIVLVAGLLLYLHLLQIWMIYLSAMILGFCGAIFGPAAASIIPNIVEENQLTQASSADQFVNSFCTIIGMLAGGFMYALVGITLIFILNGISYFLSGVMEYFVEIPYKKPEKTGEKSTIDREINKAVKELGEGFRYLYQNKLVYNLVLMNFLFVFFCVPTVNVYTPYFFNVILKATPLQLSFPQSAIWMGVLLGSFTVPMFLHRYKLKDSIFWGLLIGTMGISLETLAFYPQIRSYFSNWEITAFLTAPKIIGGLSMTFFIIPINVIYQKFTSDEYRGRFWGLQASLMTLAMSSGYFLAGFFAQRVWLGYLFYIPAIGLLIMNYWFTNLKEIKELGG